MRQWVTGVLVVLVIILACAIPIEQEITPTPDPTLDGVSMTTIDKQVAYSVDDITISVGLTTAYLTTDYITAGFVALYGLNSMSSGARFRGITIPRYANITSAYIELYAESETATITDVCIKGEKSATPAVFSDGAGGYTDFVGRSWTDKYTSWHITAAAWDIGNYIQSPSIIDIVQELVDAYDYSSGVMSFLWGNVMESSDDFKQAYQWDYDESTTYSAKLHIEYEPYVSVPTRIPFKVAGRSTPTGTISTAVDDATITGSGTNFTKWCEGDKIQLPDTNWYTISSIASDTSLEIDETYGADTSAQSYHMRHIDFVMPITVHKETEVQPITACALVSDKAASAGQGVACDGEYLYTSANVALYKKRRDATAITSNLTPLVGGSGGDLDQINSIYIHTDGKLYIGANNHPTGNLGYIRVYNQSDLAYVEEHQVQNYTCEGCCWDEDEECWWVVYHNYGYLAKYNSSWVYQTEYALSEHDYYQSVTKIGKYFYLPQHTESKVHVYSWTGSGFTYGHEITLTGINPVYGVQGGQVEDNTDIFWFAGRTEFGGTANAYKATPPPQGIYLGKNVRGDFYDVEFRDTDAKTLLKKFADYGADYSAGNYLTIYVKFPIIEEEGTDTTYYVYFDNDTEATDTSDIANTFLWAEDFVSIADWTTVTGSPSVSSGILTIPDGSGTAQELYRSLSLLIGDGIKFVARYKLQTGGTVPAGDVSIQLARDDSEGDYYNHFYYESYTYDKMEVYIGSAVKLALGASSDLAVPDTSYHVFELTKHPDDEWSYIKDGATIEIDSAADEITTSLIDQVRLKSERDEALYFDYIYITKNAYLNPVITAIEDAIIILRRGFENFQVVW